MSDMKSKYQIFQCVSNKYPLSDSVEGYTHRPVYNGNDPYTGERTFADLGKTHYFNTNRYIEPYASRYFGSSIETVTACEDLSFVPINDQRIDPNKIFNTDIQSLKSLAAEQYKLTKLFEKKFTEVLSDKNKYGLTEDDVAAMQALTAAKTAIGNYTKEIVNIKKVSTELKIKAQQAAREQSMVAGTGKTNGSSNPYSSAKDLLDNIFDAAKDVPGSFGSYDAPSINPDTFSSLPSVDSNILNESRGVVTKVRVGATDDDVTFVSYDRDGNPMPDVITPSVDDIVNVDRASHTVTTKTHEVYNFDDDNMIDGNSIIDIS